ncbi:MAG: hypothetical protein GX817_03990 [Elusimicrobia bacterium]|nr:hypothetical protein [Elusimicrobiota bacterium]
MKNKKYSTKALYCLLSAIILTVVSIIVFPDYLYFLTQFLIGLLILFLFVIFNSQTQTRILSIFLLAIFIIIEYLASVFTTEKIFFSRKALIISLIMLAGMRVSNKREKKKSFSQMGHIVSQAFIYASLGALIGGIVGSSPIVLFYRELDQGIYIFYALSVFIPLVFALLGGGYGLGRAIYELRQGLSLIERDSNA